MVASLALCQQPPAGGNQKVQADPVVIIVTGTFEPVPLSEANRSVLALDTRTEPLLYDSLVDHLHLDPSVDLKERGSNGVQADLSIRGAGFEQSLVLLNGLRINDAQSGHHNMDIPVPLEAVSRIEVLHGAGSTLYGADALGGAVNFITASPEASDLRVGFGVGNFAFNQQRLSGSYLAKGWSEQAAASRDFSTGFMTDRDYTSSALSSETRFTTAVGNTDVLLAGSDPMKGSKARRFSLSGSTCSRLVSVPSNDFSCIFGLHLKHFMKRVDPERSKEFNRYIFVAALLAAILAVATVGLYFGCAKASRPEHPTSPPPPSGANMVRNFVFTPITSGASCCG
jgi:hypothetical protein